MRSFGETPCCLLLLLHNTCSSGLNIQIGFCLKYENTLDLCRLIFWDINFRENPFVNLNVQVVNFFLSGGWVKIWCPSKPGINDGVFEIAIYAMFFCTMSIYMKIWFALTKNFDCFRRTLHMSELMHFMRHGFCVLSSLFPLLVSMF